MRASVSWVVAQDTFVALHCFVTTNMSIDKSSFDNNTNRKKEKGNCYNNYRGYEDLNHIKLLYLQVQKYDNPTNTTRVVHNLTHKDKQVMVVAYSKFRI